MSGVAFKEHSPRPRALELRRADRLCRNPFRWRTGRIPDTGRLLFFCDPTSSGALKEEQPGASVMFLIDKTDRLRRREFPLEFDNPAYGR